MIRTDVAIVGGGPGGTATALFLERLGIRSTIIEKDPFPRFHIGESMTGECGNTIRSLGLKQEMLDRNYPVKYGVKVFGPQGRQAFSVPVKGLSPEGELYDSFTWHVRRSDFDQMMLDTALERRATFLQGEALQPLFAKDDIVRGVRVKTAAGATEEIVSGVLVDASGATAFLSRASVASKKERGNYTNQVAVFSHVTGVVCDPGKGRNNTLIFYQKKNHWAWFIPIDDEVVSIGVVVPAAYLAAKKESKHKFFLREIRELNPHLASRVAKVTLVEDVHAASNYSYHIKEFTGKGYVCVGDSHRFIDPIFSFGLHFAVAEARMAAEAIAAYLGNANGNKANPFAAYQQRAELGQDVIQTLIDAFWNHPLAFGFLVHVRHVEDFTNLFAGRVYLDEPTPGLLDTRALNV